MNKKFTHTVSTTRLFTFGSALSITLAAFAALAVTTIMPRVARDLDNLELFPLAFGMALAGQLVGTAAAGGWCDARGPKPSLYVGLILFIGGLTVCGIAPTMVVFIVGRTLQGLGGGFLMVPMYVLVGQLVPPNKQPKTFAIFAAAWVVPALVGPGLAGVVIEYFSWRYIFFGLVPFILLAAVVLLPLLLRLENQQNLTRDKNQSVLIAACGAGFSVALVQIGMSLSGTLMWLVTLAGLALLIVSVPKMLPPGTLSMAKGLPSIVASRGLVNATFVATESFLPLLLQEGRDWTPKASGLVITAGSLTWALGSLLQSRVNTDELRSRLPVIGGTIITLGVALTAIAAFDAIPAWLTIIGWALSGLGIGLSYPSLAVLALASVPQEVHGKTSSSLQLADSLGAAAAIAAVTGLFASIQGPARMLIVPAFAVLLGIWATVAGSRIGFIPINKTKLPPQD